MSRIDVLNKRVARVLNLRGCGDTSPEEYDDADAALSDLVATAKDARMKERALLDFGWMIHDNMTVMQAAWIEWKHGGGAEAAMEWIENSLDGPGLIPDDAIVDAQEFFDANVSHAVKDKAEQV